MKRLTLGPYNGFAGQLTLPGSKSIANRSILLAALANGKTRLENLPVSEDIYSLLFSLPQLGVELDRELASLPALDSDLSGEQKNISVQVTGQGGAFGISKAELNLQNAGTALRPLVALLCASQGQFLIDGNEQMRRRPILDLVEGLRRLGVDIACSETGCPPVRIHARGIAGGQTRLSGKVSSQFISALLMAAPLAKEADVEILTGEMPVSRPYIDLTIAMMAEFGIEVKNTGYTYYRVPRGVYQTPGRYFVEGDATAATYFMAAGILSQSGSVRIDGLDMSSKQGDIRFLEVIERMGGVVISGDGFITVHRRPGLSKLFCVDLDMNHMPDAAMTLAVLALFADGTTHIRNIANLRVKESERIRGLRTELEKLGAHVVEEPDALNITPPAVLQRAEIETYKDHRMAMAFSLASAATEVTILDPDCCAKTYPGYFGDFHRLAVGKN